jgi:hemin uptake protein HemP
MLIPDKKERRLGMFMNYLPISDRNRPTAARNQRHSERIELVRRIPYTVTASPDEDIFIDHHGMALLINITSQGMLLVMEEAPKTDQVINVRVPTPSDPIAIPTLAEVRWTQKVALDERDDVYLVGLKFLF